MDCYSVLLLVCVGPLEVDPPINSFSQRRVEDGYDHKEIRAVPS